MKTSKSFVVVNGVLETPPACKPIYGYASHGDLQKHGEYAINWSGNVDWGVWLKDANYVREDGRWYADLGCQGRILAGQATASSLDQLIQTAN